MILGALFRNGAVVYEVAFVDKNGNRIVEEVEDGTLGFGATCPVTVTILPDNDAAITAVDADVDDADHLEGEIVLCTPSTTDSNAFVYTAVIFLDGASKVRYEGGIDESRVVYRKVVDENVADNNSSCGCSAAVGTKTNCVDASSSQQNGAESTYIEMVTRDQQDGGGSCEEGEIIEATMPMASASASARNQFVPSSIITCNNAGASASGGTNITLSATDSFVSSTNANSNASADGSSMSQSRMSKKQRYMSEIDIGISPKENANHIIEIAVPLWLQKDCQSQRNLFFHLIGPNGYNSKHIEYNSRCKVRVKVILGEKGNVISVPMTIHVEAMNAPTALEDLTVARQMIQSLLLQFVGNDGSRGRLLYEVAQSCWGPHRPNESTSNAVRDVNPFHNHPSEDYMSVVELPYNFTREGTPVHAASLLSRETLDRLKAADAFIRVVATEFKIPTKLCEPYALVCGKSYQSVDRGVDIVKEIIRRRKKEQEHIDAQWAL